MSQQRVRNRIVSVVRIRPVTDDDYRCGKIERNLLNICIAAKPDKRTVVVTKDTYVTKELKFDQVYGPSTDQQSIYEHACKHVVTDACSGYNASIITYGQTGSGKSYTMFGSGYDISDRASLDPITGVVHFAMQDILSYLEKRRNDGLFCALQMSMFQIYQERITDLLLGVTTAALGPLTEKEEKQMMFELQQRRLDIREYPNEGVVIEGLGHFPITRPSNAISLLSVGLANRITRSVTANEHSSRSHVIVRLSITCQDLTEDGSYDQKVRCSHLMLVDLAGSERVRKSGSVNDRRTLNEAQSINKSISNLGMCIHALASAGDRGVKPGHVPFRNSKLTRILEESLGGKAMASVIATVGPCLLNVEETLSTLQFAKRCTSVKKIVKRVKLKLPDLLTDQLIDWTWPLKHAVGTDGVQEPGEKQRLDIEQVDSGDRELAGISIITAGVSDRPSIDAPSSPLQKIFNGDLNTSMEEPLRSDASANSHFSTPSRHTSNGEYILNSGGSASSAIWVRYALDDSGISISPDFFPNTIADIENTRSRRVSEEVSSFHSMDDDKANGSSHCVSSVDTGREAPVHRGLLLLLPEADPNSMLKLQQGKGSFSELNFNVVGSPDGFRDSMEIDEPHGIDLLEPCEDNIPLSKKEFSAKDEGINKIKAIDDDMQGAEALLALYSSDADDNGILVEQDDASKSRRGSLNVSSSDSSSSSPTSPISLDEYGNPDMHSHSEWSSEAMDMTLGDSLSLVQITDDLDQSKEIGRYDSYSSLSEPMKVVSPVVSTEITGINSPKTTRKAASASAGGQDMSMMLHELHCIFDSEESSPSRELRKVVSRQLAVPKLSISGYASELSTGSSDTDDQNTDSTDFMMAKMTDSPPAVKQKTMTISNHNSMSRLELEEKIAAIKSTQETISYIMEKLIKLQMEGDRKLISLMNELEIKDSSPSQSNERGEPISQSFTFENLIPKLSLARVYDFKGANSNEKGDREKLLPKDQVDVADGFENESDGADSLVAVSNSKKNSSSSGTEEVCRSQTSSMGSSLPSLGRRPTISRRSSMSEYLLSTSPTRKSANSRADLNTSSKDVSGTKLDRRNSM